MGKLSKFRFFVMAAISTVPVLRTVRINNYVQAHLDEFTVEEKYRIAIKLIDTLRKRSRTKTKVFGAENLPKEGGYILYSNHQGKYDAIGILYSHEKPLAILMEKKQSQKIVAKEVIDLCEGKRLDFNNPREQLKILSELAKEVKEGKRFLIFPEGKYEDNKNTLLPFNVGCFRCALESESPIVPVTIIDSYKAMNGTDLKPVVTQVHFLDPIPYEEFKSMKKGEISELIKTRIQNKLDEVLQSRKGLPE